VLSSYRAIVVALALALPISLCANRVRVVAARFCRLRRRESGLRPSEKVETYEVEMAGSHGRPAAGLCQLPSCPGGCDKLECPGCGIPLAPWPNSDSKPMCVACGFRVNAHRSASSQKRYEWEIHSLPGWGWREGWADGGKVKHLWQLPAEPDDTPDGLRAEARHRRFDSYNTRSDLLEQLSKLDAEDAKTAEIERRADMLAEGDHKVDELERWLAELSLDAGMDLTGPGPGIHDECLRRRDESDV
jgi:hypothetical protein